MYRRGIRAGTLIVEQGLGASYIILIGVYLYGGILTMAQACTLYENESIVAMIGDTVVTCMQTCLGFLPSS